MEIAIVLIALLVIALFGLLIFRLLKWILARNRRKLVVLAMLCVVIISVTMNHLFFKNMHFIQSNVYHNLYLIRYPEKDQVVVQEAIQKKIKEHLQTEDALGHTATYTGEHIIYFYEYSKHFAFNIFQDAGTHYFIENEEDLGGFVSEELGMYTQYGIAEFYVEPCQTDSKLYCGEINYFYEGEFLKAEKLVFKK